MPDGPDAGLDENGTNGFPYNVSTRVFDTP
jgi:hypothetical protein